MSDYAIEIQGLSKSFGRKQVLNGLTMNVPWGETFAFLGRNGEGKTTTIRMLLGLLARDEGTIRVGGMSPDSDALKIRGQIGYLAEDQHTFGWMSVDEVIGFTSAFYPTWDNGYCQKLATDFDLPMKTKVKSLSKGQNVRLGLLLALAHRPKIVILDDPTLGLDPIMRKAFIRDIIQHLQGEGVTIFLSTHLLYEIEPVADRIAILDGGRIIREAATEELLENIKRFVIASDSLEKVRSLNGLLDFVVSGRQIALVAERAAETRDALRQLGVGFEESNMNLDSIFEAYVVGNRGKIHG